MFQEILCIISGSETFEVASTTGTPVKSQLGPRLPGRLNPAIHMLVIRYERTLDILSKMCIFATLHSLSKSPFAGSTLVRDINLE